MGKPSKDYAVPLWEKANLTVYEAQPTQVLAQISYESCPTERIASLSCGTAQSGSSKGKSSMSFWKEPIQSNNQRCDSQNRIVVPNGGYRYPKAKRK